MKCATYETISFLPFRFWEVYAVALENHSALVVIVAMLRLVMHYRTSHDESKWNSIMLYTSEVVLKSLSTECVTSRHSPGAKLSVKLQGSGQKIPFRTTFIDYF